MDLRDQLQSTLGNAYTIERELGGGGMSRVFVATETALGRKVVIKVLPPETAGQVSIERFKREISLAAQLQQAHIVPLFSAGEVDGLPYYTMPFVEGESLRARLTREGELPLGDALSVLKEVARALAYAHEHGIVHRDIKPDNVLLSGGSTMVTDFGIAKALSASAASGNTSLTQLGIALGSPAYMAPEQASADPNVDARADLYAFGCMAYELLSGQLPFTGRPAPALLAAHMTEAPEPITKRRPNTPPVLAALVMQCLEKRPADRPKTAHDVVRALDAVVVTPSATTSAASSMAAPARGRRSWLPLAIAGAGGIALGLAMSRFTGATAGTTAQSSIRRLTFSGQIGCAAISPDGRAFASIVGWGSAFCTGRLVAQSLPAGRETVLLEEVGVVQGLRFSPNGMNLLFAGTMRDGLRGLFLLSRVGGTPRLLDSLSLNSSFPLVGFRDDRTVFSLRNQWLRFMDAESGAVKDSLLVPLTRNIGGLQFFPSGTAAVMSVFSGDRKYLALTDARLAITDSVEVGDATFTRTGSSAVAYFASGQGTSADLLVREVDLRRGRYSGRPRILLTAQSWVFDVTGDTAGRVLLLLKSRVSDAAWAAQVGRASNAPRSLARSLDSYLGGPVISTDGERVAFARNGLSGYNNYWIPFAGGAETQVSFDSANRQGVHWIGAKRLLMHSSVSAARPAVADLATGRLRTLTDAPEGLDFRTVLADSEWVWFRQSQNALVITDTLARVKLVVPSPVANGAFGFRAIATPDGRRVIAPVASEGKDDIALYEYTRSTNVWRFLATFGGPFGDIARLGAVGREYAYFATWNLSRAERGSLWLVPLKGAAPIRLGPLPMDCAPTSFSISADGARMVCNVTTEEPDAWIVKIK